jgi:hypothetical protein
MLRQFSCRSALVLSLISFSVTAAQAGMMLDGAPSSQYEAYTLNPLYQASGWFGLLDSSGNLAHEGSAVLVSPSWVLFAGHEIAGMEYSSLQFGLGSNVFTNPAQTRSVVATYLYPGYTGGVGGSADDLALGLLSSPIQDVTPATRFRGTDQVGTHVSIVGFGTPGTPSTGMAIYDGTERGGENVVDRIGWSTVVIGSNYVLADFGPLWFTPSLPLEFGGTAGDSGGGWFDDQGRLMAVSCFEWGSSAYTGGIRLSLYNDWIDTTIGAAVPEPATWIIFASGIPFVGLLVRRQRRQAADEG